jgi:hypothetical protein
MSKDEERYDVSQHDGITKGGWTLETIDNYPIEADKLKIVSRVGRWTRNVAVLDEDIKRVDLHAIFALPKILDALKKAYEREDQLMKVHADTREWAWEALDWVEGKVKHRDLKTVDAKEFKRWRRKFEHFMDETNEDASE